MSKANYDYIRNTVDVMKVGTATVHSTLNRKPLSDEFAIVFVRAYGCRVVVK